MATFHLNETLARKLREQAARQHRSPDDILAEWVSERLTGEEEPTQDTSEPNAMLKIALRAEELGLTSGRSDISENFDDVLREVVAEKTNRSR